MKYKISKNRHFSTPLVFRTDKTFEWQYDITIVYKNSKVTKLFDYETNERWYLISSWFGGNRKAPNTIYINKIKLQ